MTWTVKPSVVFIPGLWIHPLSWQPWIELFDQHGYPSSAPAWPGIGDTVEASRAHPDGVAGQSIDDITDSYRRLISGMERLPVLVGHSFGGMIAEKLLREEQAAAVVALDAAESRGALPAPLSELRSTLPVFKDPDAARDAVSLSSEHFRTSFGTAVDADESQALWERWAIAGPVRPLLEAAAEGYSGDSPTEVAADTDARGPLLLVLGRQDHKAAGAITKAALKASRHTRAKTDVLELPDRGPSLTIDHGWREVAEACLAWLDQVGV